jgi:TolB-like protein/Tfp pilus assembly protein PilF
MSSVFAELKRRNVFRVGAAYAVSAWVLVQIGEAVFPAFGVPDAIFRGMVILLVLGFPIALIFAWIFEKTPEGLKLEKNVDRSQSITAVTGKKLDRGIMVALAIAVAYFAVDKFYLQAPTSDEPAAGLSAQTSAGGRGSGEQAERSKSVAVLPFANMSSDPEQEYFSDGLADTVLDALAQVRDLKVAARTSSFAFRGKQQDIREIGRLLGVSTVLEGSVQKAGNRLRVITQLIDVNDGTHLWSQTFDRTDEDIFAIQDEISAAVVKALKVSLGEEDAQRLAQRPTSDIQAFDLYLLGRYEFVKRNPEALRKAIGHFEQAVAVDPGYALAYAGLADSWMFLSRTNYGDLTLQESARHARPYLEKALALAPESSEVYGTLGLYLDEFLQPGEFPGMTAIMALEKSVELNPVNTLALTWLAIRYQSDGQYRKSWQVLRGAYELDPLNTNLLINMSWWSMSRGDADGGRRYIDLAIERDPRSANSWDSKARWLWLTGDLDDALEAALRAQELEPDSSSLALALGGACSDLGETRCAALWVDRARRVSAGDTRVTAAMAWLAAKQGDLDEAVRLQKSLFDARLARGNDWGDLGTRYFALGLAEILLRQGAYSDAAELFEKIFPTLQEKLGRNDNFNVMRLLDMAWAYRNLEQTRQERAALAQARLRLQEARDGGLSFWFIDFCDALLHAQSGDKEAAEVYFQKAVDGGFTPLSDFVDTDAGVKRLGELLDYSDAYRSAMAQSEARLADLRKRAAPNIQLAIARAQL